MDKVVLASGNKGKLAEFQSFFAELDITVQPQSDFETPEAEETGLSFIENAIIKARNASEHSGLPALADDSGLAVDVLGGAPGIYSARYAKVGASDQDNIDKLLTEMTEVSEQERSASFICALAFVRHANDPLPVIAIGRWHGAILKEASGNNGFGYDPVFWVPDLECAAAELSKTEKNKISHRAQAMKSLLVSLKAEGIGA